MNGMKARSPFGQNIPIKLRKPVSGHPRQAFLFIYIYFSLIFPNNFLFCILFLAIQSDLVGINELLRS
jgi:hypothetical protein